MNKLQKETKTLYYYRQVIVFLEKSICIHRQGVPHPSRVVVIFDTWHHLTSHPMDIQKYDNVCKMYPYGGGIMSTNSLNKINSSNVGVINIYLYCDIEQQNVTE